MQPLRFEITARDGAARRGLLFLRSGVVETPAFMPVATFGAVRGVEARELEALGAQVLLANTYHLHERPGEQVDASLGGLHGFTGWSGPWLTVRGGYQGTSLADRSIDDPVQLPSRITLFKRAIERDCPSRPEMIKCIQETVLHEIGHHFGFDDEDLDGFGIG